MRVLVIEDEVRLAATLQDLLELNGYTADVCHDGEAGLDNALTGIYDVILLDVMLPKLDGFTVLRRLRGEKNTTPVLMLTARRSNGENQAALWYDGGDNVTSAPLMQDLLHDLRVMTMSKCVDYYPSDEALEICGFRNPDAILKVEYTNAGGDETFTMEVGARMPDQSGRYVRLEGTGAVYALGTDGVDALMTISAAGMRGAAQSAEPAEAGEESGEA